MANTLTAKLAKASIGVGALATDKRNVQQNYDYLSADQILTKAGRALAEQGIVIWPGIEAEQTECVEYTDSYGKTKSRYDAMVRFVMTIGDGESEMTEPWVGRGSDYAVPDKALYKAITSGHKYFLMKLLNIGVGNEDGEHEAAEQPVPTQQRKPAPAQRKPAATNGNAPKIDMATVEPVNGTVVADPKPGAPSTMPDWGNPKMAQQWAVEVGACTDIHEARESMTKIVKAGFGGTITPQNMQAVHTAFYHRQCEKLAEAQEESA